MKARTNTDKCFSTTAHMFNFDGVERTVLTPEEAMTAFDYEIITKPCFDENGRKIPNLLHLACDDGEIIPCRGVCEGFTPINHKEVFQYIVNDIMPKVPEMTLETVGTIRGRSVGIIDAKWGDTFAIKGDESPQELRLHIFNPTNGTGAMVMGFTNVRIFCENRIATANREARKDGLHISHTKNSHLELIGAVEQIRQAAVAAIEMKNRCERLAEIGVNSEMVRKALDAVYPIKNLPEESFAYARMKNLREEVLKQFDEGETHQTMSNKTSGWALFNSFTYPIFNPEEKRLAKSKTKDAAEIAYKGMNGSVAEKVTKIFDKVFKVVA